MNDSETGDLPAVFPQSYPLWAVRACSIDDDSAEVGLVVGWEHNPDSHLRVPVVAPMGQNGGSPYGVARDWRNDIVRSDKPEWRWIERVELYLTRDEAELRGPELFREVDQAHRSEWPEDSAQ